MVSARPQYHYQQHMPFARQPLKTIYVIQRMATTLLLVPLWVLYYSFLPQSKRPRPSWSLKQIIAVNFTRRIYKVTELAGVTWNTRNPDEACDNRTLKETSFEWVDSLPEDLRTGIVADKQVPFKRVGAFVWPKESSEDADAADVPTIGVFLHGGGYSHMSAHENSPTSKIPRQLIKDKAMSKIYAVEYRLLQYAPFPAAVQDAAAVYTHIIRQHQCRSLTASTNSNSDSLIKHNEADLLTANRKSQTAQERRENEDVRQRVAHAAQRTQCKVILIGDSAGGNLVLALARWIRDEGVLPPPDGLLLLSPSCDPSHAFPETPSSYVPRPHASTDYLLDTPEPRALLQRTFLGHNPLETMHSPYVSPASARVLRAYYGDAFAASVQDLTIRQMDTLARERLRTMVSAPATPVPPTPTEIEACEGADGSPTSLACPVIASPRGLSLFSEFPQTCVVLGDAERLEREVMRLVGAMERDGVEVRTVWVEDGVHDVLMMGWWDERVRAKVWREVEEWVRTV
ncbi:alpha/beta-hydrolase [Wolfiporia cocos MD-104 SS10]|uniref:Alpha/beta-hydrolase n=1 Tax=Wolfiporia cocos (strain MD-104) TaxID=742152 RepID=A0A2H3J6K6_WOLCO|nr:alpha/beta-hydrolase [Wolfiporia cocos MD-104 SS10]